MYYTIYKITNLINGKIYIGKHKTDNIDDGYMGSGKGIKAAIRKYGVFNFKKEILSYCETEESMNLMESLIVNQDFVNRKDTYNIMLGGEGSWNHVTTEQKRLGRINANKVIFEKYGVDNPNKLEKNKALTRERNLNSVKNGTHPFLNKEPTFLGKHHTDETKQKIGYANSIHQNGDGNSQFGTMWITDGINNKKIKKGDDVPEGWYKGRVIKIVVDLLK